MKKLEEMTRQVNELYWVSFLPGENGKKWSDYSLGHARDLLERYNNAVTVRDEKAKEMTEIGRLLSAHCKRMQKEVELFFDDKARASAEEAARIDATQIPLIDEAD